MAYYYLVVMMCTHSTMVREPLQNWVKCGLSGDRFDFALLKAAEERQIPIFGICRGMQVLNVYPVAAPCIKI